jgi:hypothetical protein
MRSVVSRLNIIVHTRALARLCSTTTKPANTSIAGLKAGNVLGGENCCPKAFETFKAWHDVVSVGVTDKPDQKQLEAAADKFANHVDEKILFSPPTYFKPWVGRDEFITIISCVGEVFGKSFKYGRQFISPDGRDWALEFTANIADSGKALTGMDVVKLDENGKIVDFYVIARPPNAIAELKKEMMARVPQRMVKMKAKKMASSFFG